MVVRNKSRELELSPSAFHGRLMKATERKLAYRRGDVAGWQARLRRKLRALLGHLPPRAGRVPLRVRSLWKQTHALGSIEKIAFRAEPGAEVLAYVCLPKQAQPPYDFFICLQGHSTGMHVSIARQRENEKLGFKTEGDRDFALGCMKRGVAALCIEQRSFGLRREQLQKNRSEHGCIDATMHALMLGRTLIGERVFDIDRGIDYLAARGDANMKTLGVMGNSGGGTISLFSAALLPRLKLAMPSCYFCTFADSIMSIHHCVDNYVPGMLLWAEMADVMGLFAPKPVVIVAGKTDPIFPLPGVKKAFRQLKKIYNAAGAGRHCHLVVGNGGHRFYAKAAWEKMLRELRGLKERGT
jgi:dienelactone hydrolase